MREIEKRENKGYEIECYYPKEYGKYTEKTGNTRKVIQCANVGEVAQWFARRSWAAPFEDSNIACPTVWLNGKKWCFGEYNMVEKFYGYKIVWESGYPPCYFDTEEKAKAYLHDYYKQCEENGDEIDKGTIEEFEK